MYLFNQNKFIIMKLSELEKVLYDWFIPYKKCVNIIRELIMKKTEVSKKDELCKYARILFFFQSWLECLKSRHSIKIYHFFGGSDLLIKAFEEQFAIYEKKSRLIFLKICF
jgi:hypothetical protein